MSSLRRRVACFAALALLAGCQSEKPIERDTLPLSSRELVLHVQAFDEVWAKVDATYFAPKRLVAIDWNGARDSLRPKIQKAKTAREARAIISQLLARLGETHFALIPAERYERADASTAALAGDVGITPRVVEGEVVVWRVAAGSSAAKAGVRTGWILRRVDDVDVPRASTAQTRPAATRPAMIALQRRAQDLLAAAPREKRTALFIDGTGHERNVTLTGREIDEAFAQLGNLPAMSLRIESRRLAGGVGYFSLSSFLDPPRVMPAFEAFIRRNIDAPGIVIDLRGNPGGISGMATGLAGHFVDRESLKLGSMITRDSTLNFVVNPRLPTYRGKVAVLVDSLSQSSSEIFAAGLRDLGVARIFGQPTPGAALPSTVTQLSSGDQLQFAVADFVRTGGERLEGVGVTPDEIVPLRRSDLLAGKDAPLLAAVKWIRSPATQPAARP